MMINCDQHLNQTQGWICIEKDCSQNGPQCTMCKNIHPNSHQIYPLESYLRDQLISIKIGRVIPGQNQISQTASAILVQLDTFLNKICQKIGTIHSNLQNDMDQLTQDAQIQYKLENQRAEILNEIVDGKIKDPKQYRSQLQETIAINHGLIAEKQRYDSYSMLQSTMQGNMDKVFAILETMMQPPNRRFEKLDTNIDSPTTHQMPYVAPFSSVGHRFEEEQPSQVSRQSEQGKQIQQKDVSSVGHFHGTQQKMSTQKTQKFTDHQQSVLPMENFESAPEQFKPTPCDQEASARTNDKNEGKLLQDNNQPKIQKTQSKISEGSNASPAKQLTNQQTQQSDKKLYNNNKTSQPNESIIVQKQQTIQQQEVTPPQQSQTLVTPQKNGQTKPMQSSSASKWHDDKKIQMNQQQPKTVDEESMIPDTTRQIIEQLTMQQSHKFPTFNGDAGQIYLSQSLQKKPNDPPPRNTSPNEQLQSIRVDPSELNYSVIKPNQSMMVSGMLKAPPVKRTYYPPDVVPVQHQKVLSIKAHDKAVKCMVLLRNDLIASAASEPAIKIWNRDNLTLNQTLEGHTASLHCLAYDSSKDLLASGSMDKTVRVWSHVKNQFKEWLTLIGHNDKVRTMVFYDEYLASGGDDTEIIVWSLLNGDIVHRISDSNQGRVSAMLATPEHLIVGCNKTIMFFSLKDFSDRSTIKGHDSLVISLAMLEPDRINQLFQLKESMKKMQLVETQPAQGINRLNQRNRASLLGGPLDERVLASGGKDLKIKLWNYQSRQLVYTINEDYVPITILHIQKLNYLVFGLTGFEREGKIIMWNINDKQHAFVQGEIVESGTGVNALLMYEDRKDVLIYAAYENKRIEIYKLQV